MDKKLKVGCRVYLKNDLHVINDYKSAYNSSMLKGQFVDVLRVLNNGFMFEIEQHENAVYYYSDDMIDWVKTFAHINIPVSQYKILKKDVCLTFKCSFDNDNTLSDIVKKFIKHHFAYLEWEDDCSCDYWDYSFSYDKRSKSESLHNEVNVELEILINYDEV